MKYWILFSFVIINSTAIPWRNHHQFGSPHRHFGSPHRHFGSPHHHFGSYSQSDSDYSSEEWSGENSAPQPWKDTSGSWRSNNWKDWIWPNHDNHPWHTKPTYPQPNTSKLPQTKPPTTLKPQPKPTPKPTTTPKPQKKPTTTTSRPNTSTEVPRPPITNLPPKKPSKTTTTTTTFRTSTSSSSPIPYVTPSPSLVTCMSGCSVTSQFNPVCGTDGITYSNVGRLECAKFCGIDVEVLRYSRCPTNDGSSSTSTSSPIGSSTLSTEAFNACMTSCPATAEYNPVCGSNGITYANPSRLECAKLCGISVQVVRASRCPTDATQSPNTNPTPTPTTSANPITSTRYTSISGSSSSETFTTPSNNRLNFTIPQDILDMVFSVTTDDPDYTGLIDERFETN